MCSDVKSLQKLQSKLAATYVTTLSKSYYINYISAISSALTGRNEDNLCKVDC